MRIPDRADQSEISLIRINSTGQRNFFDNRLDCAPLQSDWHNESSMKSEAVLQYILIEWPVILSNHSAYNIETLVGI